MKQRLYIDTSVFGGYFDVEFEEVTKPFFDRILKREFIVVFSNITEQELQNAPQKVKDLMSMLPADTSEYLQLTTEATELAQKYIEENVVGKTSFADCLHIALATIYKADLLVSWNFKHIVNVVRIRGYNSVNLKLGYSTIDIRSPRELIDYEK
jgi:predicted nucleic acid-binding protein